jgi:hypothetical protein
LASAFETKKKKERFSTYVGLASLDGLGSEHDSLHGRGAHLVNSGGDSGLREAGTKSNLTSGVLA